MDFGLAKTSVMRPAASSSATVTLSTQAESHPLTAQGTVVGTLHHKARRSAGFTWRPLRPACSMRPCAWSACCYAQLRSPCSLR
jgi:hypothetical protein